jgi:hypothetical protein
MARNLRAWLCVEGRHADMRAGDQELAEYFPARFDWARRIAFAMCGTWPEAIAQTPFVRIYHGGSRSAT